MKALYSFHHICDTKEEGVELQSMALELRIMRDTTSIHIHHLLHVLEQFVFVLTRVVVKTPVSMPTLAIIPIEINVSISVNPFCFILFPIGKITCQGYVFCL